MDNVASQPSIESVASEVKTCWQLNANIEGVKKIMDDEQKNDKRKFYCIKTRIFIKVHA